MWIQVYDENDAYIATFGLWSYCEYDANMCMSVHDNIIPGKDVPREYYSCEPTDESSVIEHSYVIGSRILAPLFSVVRIVSVEFPHWSRPEFYDTCHSDVKRSQRGGAHVGNDLHGVRVFQRHGGLVEYTHSA